MATAKQTRANAANAQSSAGPQTPAGKARSSRNALQHGLASGQLLIRGESLDDFEALVAALSDEYLPAGAVESVLIHQMARHHWLAGRALRLQADAFYDTLPGKIPASLDVLLRYQVANERAFHRALAALEKLRQARSKQAAAQPSTCQPSPRQAVNIQPQTIQPRTAQLQNGFVSQKPAAPKSAPAAAVPRAPREPASAPAPAGVQPPPALGRQP